MKSDLKAGNERPQDWQPVFDSLDFRQGADLALGLAPVGLISAILSGVIMVNWARRKGMLIEDTAQTENPSEPDAAAGRPDRPAHVDDNTAIDPLSFTLGLVAASVAVGVVLLEALQWVERATWSKNGLD